MCSFYSHQPVSWLHFGTLVIISPFTFLASYSMSTNSATVGMNSYCSSKICFSILHKLPSTSDLKSLYESKEFFTRFNANFRVSFDYDTSSIKAFNCYSLSASFGSCCLDFVCKIYIWSFASWISKLLSNLMVKSSSFLTPVFNKQQNACPQKSSFYDNDHTILDCSSSPRTFLQPLMNLTEKSFWSQIKGMSYLGMVFVGNKTTSELSVVVYDFSIILFGFFIQFCVDFANHKLISECKYNKKIALKNRYNPKPTITKIIIFSLNKQKKSELKMNDDDYGVDNRMDDEEDIELDDEDSQNISEEYGDSEQAEGEDDLDREDKGSDQEREDEEGDELESVPEEEEPENRYEVIQEDEIVYDQPNVERITSPFMTKYEKARIIGVRAVQISKNSPLYLTADSNSLMNWDPLTIAEKELSEKKIPFIVRRYLPDGSFEDWKLSELKTFD